jgi:uncharacterized protein (DUF885 family)
VDTGLNAKGWSRQQAIGYLSEHTPMLPSEIESEVDRYLAAPGQALAYMTGRIHIQDLRTHAATVLGARFDIRDFHEVVLGHGRLPLASLTWSIQEWLTEVTGEPPSNL